MQSDRQNKMVQGQTIMTVLARQFWLPSGGQGSGWSSYAMAWSRTTPWQACPSA